MLEKDKIYYAVGDKILIKGILSKVHPEEIRGAVPTTKIKLFSSKEEALDYILHTIEDVTTYERAIKWEKDSKISPIFEVTLKNSIETPQICSDKVGLLLYPCEYKLIDVTNVRFISGEVPRHAGKFEFKRADKENMTTPYERLVHDLLDKMKFEAHLKSFEKKEMRLSAYSAALSEIQAIRKGLEKARERLIEGSIPPEFDASRKQFINECLELIKTERTTELAKHRGLLREVRFFIQNIIQKIKPDFQFITDSMSKISIFRQSFNEINQEETDKEERPVRNSDF